MHKRMLEITVGLFMLTGLIALSVLAMKISGLVYEPGNHYYSLSAQFDNIGSLKERAPIRMAGVRIGEVGEIALDPSGYRAQVNLLIDTKHHLPVDTSASILTQGLLGANYIGLTPGYKENYLKSGDEIKNTHPALVLERLIGQLIFKMSKEKK